MKILVIGCGSIGRRHIRLLKETGVEVCGFDVKERLDALEAEFPDVTFYAPYGRTRWLHMPIFSQFDGIIVATPNNLHAEPAQAALCCGRPVLIEKPMTTTVRDAEVLISEAAAPILVGYCLRHHAGLRKLKELLDQDTIGRVRHASIHFGSYLPGWRPGFDYRQGYAASKEQGGGILLDASHELHYACWLFGEPVSVMAQVQNTGALEIETEDVADLVVRFESGLQVSIHLDYLNTRYSRGCTIIGDKGTLLWSMEPGNSVVSLQHPGVAATGAVWDLDSTDDLYRAELAHFLRVLQGQEQPLVTGGDGLRVLRVVEAAKRSSEEGRVVVL